MSDKKLRLAIIGCGSMARGHLDGYISIKEKEPDKLELVAMCDPVAEQAQSFADKAAKTQKSAPGVYTDLNEMLMRTWMRRIYAQGTQTITRMASHVSTPALMF